METMNLISSKIRVDSDPGCFQGSDPNPVLTQRSDPCKIYSDPQPCVAFFLVII